MIRQAQTRRALYGNKKIDAFFYYALYGHHVSRYSKYIDELNNEFSTATATRRLYGDCGKTHHIPGSSIGRALHRIGARGPYAEW